MKLTFLGTASGVPVGNRKPSALLLESGDSRVLFDAGEGVCSSLIALNSDINAIDRIYLSHTHPDHISGLPLLLQSMHLGNRQKPLFIVADQRIHVWLQSMLHGMFLVPSRWDFEVRFVNLSFIDFPEVSSISVSSVENTHLDRARPVAEEFGLTAACYSFLIHTDGQHIFLSSDIGSIQDVREHAKSVSTAVIEATHVSMEELFAVVDENPQAEFVFTHIPPELEVQLEDLRKAARIRFSERVRFADDGFELHLTNGRQHG
jgi:ribonuclease BN (tRNA processing enzyme)